MTSDSQLPENCAADTSSTDANLPGAASASSLAANNVPPFVTPEADNVQPYWIPPGLDIDGWPPHIRAHVAAVINPEYEELVLNAKPGVGRQMAISLLHLGWLEILDHLRLGRLVPPPVGSDPFEVLSLDSRQHVIARHLRLVNSKLKIAQFLLRLDEFKANCRPQNDRELPADDALLSTSRDINPNELVRYVIKNGKDDVCGPTAGPSPAALRPRRCQVV